MRGACPAGTRRSHAAVAGGPGWPDGWITQMPGGRLRFTRALGLRGAPAAEPQVSNDQDYALGIMIRVLTTAASMPVAAWVAATELYSPCQTITSRMLPPDRLYSEVSIICAR